VLALVKQQEVVTVTVPASERGDVALLYEPGVHAVKDGKSQVTFQACTGGNTSWPGATQFNGGIYVYKPMCLTLQVSVGADQPTTVSTPIGLDRSKCT
jgi:hypothetical protein